MGSRTCCGGIAVGLSGRVIAAGLNRSPSTVAREIARNGGREAYRAVVADVAAYYRASRPKPSKLATNQELRERVSALLVEDWSPQQIAARLHLAQPGRAGVAGQPRDNLPGPIHAFAEGVRGEHVSPVAQ